VCSRFTEQGQTGSLLILVVLMCNSTTNRGLIKLFVTNKNETNLWVPAVLWQRLQRRRRY